MARLRGVSFGKIHQINMFQFLLSCFYFFLPAYFTNMTPPLMKKAGLFNFLDKPVDFGKKFFGKPILGSHKTWRGVICGIFVGFLITLFQKYLYQFPTFQEISILDYNQINIFFLGLIIPSGAIFGDLLFSFIKRRISLKPGAKFLPFDQTNYVIGVAFFTFLFSKFNIKIEVWLTLFILTFFLHIIFNRIGYLLHLHNAKW